MKRSSWELEACDLPLLKFMRFPSEAKDALPTTNVFSVAKLRPYPGDAFICKLSVES